MLRSAKSSTPFRSNPSASTSNSGASGSSSSVFKSNQSITSAETALHPNLGLHSAAATGNVGLVKFALDNGQPHTSILNGLLPLHAACSGGSEPVVRLLLSYGADVNATRGKAAKGSGSGPGTGTEGSSPLHFACANGHFSIVRLLLENGARPSARDKDRQTPLTLASSQGHAACVSLLKSWIASYGPNGLARPLMNAFSSRSNSYSDQGQNSSPIRNQRSFESLSSAAAGVKASLRNHKKQALAKVNSNPNLKSIASSASSYGSPPFLPPPLPTFGRNASESNSNSPQTLSSVPHSLTHEYKRRPSLPSIFERAAHPSSTIQSFLSSNSLQPESIEELDVETKNVGGKPSVSPNRTTHRLLGKRSFTGLLSKAGSSNVEHSSQVPTIDPKYATQRNGSIVEESKAATLPLPLPVSARARSGSIGMLGQPLSTQVAKSDKADTSLLSSSPISSVDNYDSSTRQNSTPSHSYRPRKSSNLSVTTSNPSPLIAQGSDQDYNKDNLSVEQGRKRSQSATGVPKQSPSAIEIESLRKLSLSQQSTTGEERSHSRSDDAKEFLQPTSIPTRYRSHRSPLLSSKLLNEEIQSRSSSTTSLVPRQIHSQRSASSLASSSSSSIAKSKTSRGNSFPSAGVEEEEAVPKVRLETGDGSRSTSYAESPKSKMSMKTFGVGMSAQEQAQAILRTAEGQDGDTPAISLTQMLAAYGEALAQERRKASSSYSPDHLRKQGSIASLSSNRLASVSELPVPTSTETGHRSQTTSISTPPDSPQTTRSRAESNSTSFSRPSSSHRPQKGKMVFGGESFDLDERDDLLIIHCEFQMLLLHCLDR
jgi:hypothetical protein